MHCHLLLDIEHNVYLYFARDVKQELYDRFLAWSLLPPSSIP